MSMPIDTFVGLVIDSQLLSAGELRLFIESVPPDRRPQDGEQLARQLVKQKRITAYQAKTIYHGKGKILVLGNYRILDKLGEGGMGMVLKAEHTRMERLVALKVLSPRIVKLAGALQRFQREVKAAARLSHPNIVTTHDSDEVKGTHFLVMEFVDGLDLASLVRKRGRLPVDRALDCVLQAAKGIDYAHRQHVIHRDIKPSNLILDRQGTVKVLDFGLARGEHEMFEHTELTYTGAMMGSLDYMSPEHAADAKHADARSDIYSLGCTLFYLLNARPVHAGQTVMSKLLAHREAPVPSLREQCSEVPEAVERLFRSMVAKKPEDRPRSMAEVIAQLEQYAVPASTGAGVSNDPPDDGELQELLSLAANPPAEAWPMDAVCALLADVEAAVGIHESPTVTGKSSALEETPTRQRKPSLPLKDGGGERLTNPRPSWRQTRWLLSATGAFVLAVSLLYAGVFLRVTTPTGTIVVEVDQPELAGAVVSVDGHQKITIQTPGSVEPIEIKADEQRHTLQVVKGGFETFTKEFTVKSGKSESIRVRLEPIKTAANDAPQVAAAKSTATTPLNPQSAIPNSQSPPAFGYALEFDGKTSYVQIESLKFDFLKDNPRQPVTMEAFVSAQSLVASPPARFIVQRAPLGLLQTGRSTNANRWHFSASVASGTLYTQQPLRVDETVHLAGVYDGQAIRLYLDGKRTVEARNYLVVNEETQDALDQTFALSSQYVARGGMWLGGGQFVRAEWGNYFHGRIDELRVSKIARYTADFTPRARVEPDKDTLALYHFDEGQGDVLTDCSGNGHHGKIVNAKWVAGITEVPGAAAVSGASNRAQPQVENRP
jgi:serine/threonine protein kinase